jgi:hypothetical protein
MNSLSNLNELIHPEFSQLELIPTLFSFFMCILMSFIIREFYIRRSFSLTGKMHIGSIIPILSAVVFLVIIVVKSSLALSLGLVGALSIVRFRTPIKEPEELVYLFLSIATGLAYAAGQVIAATIIILLILLMIFLWLSNRSNIQTNEYNLIVKWEQENILFEDVSKVIMQFTQNLKLIRLDKSYIGNTAVMLINPEQNSSIEEISKILQKLDNKMVITFFEAKSNW